MPMTEHTMMFINHYHCPSCGTDWHDRHTSQVNDDCPSCGARHISPVDSEDAAPDDVLCRCANCDWHGPESELKELQDVFERVSPGDVMPAGECPECGASAFVENEHDRMVTLAHDMHTTIVGLLAWAAKLGGWEAPVWEISLVKEL